VISDEEIIKLLADPACPWATFWRGKGDRAIMVDDAVRFIWSRAGVDLSAETQLDDFVHRVGGRRVSVIDPWKYLARLIPKRLRGPEGSGDVYEIPQSALATGNAPT
jgi:hypothetical protein